MIRTAKVPAIQVILDQQRGDRHVACQQSTYLSPGCRPLLKRRIFAQVMASLNSLTAGKVSHLIFFAMIASPALAAEQRVKNSRVQLGPTDQPGAAAEIRFINDGADGWQRHTETFDLTGHGVSVSVTATVGDTMDDTIVVTVPDGFIAIPDTLTIPDGTASVLHVYPLNAVGM